VSEWPLTGSGKLAKQALRETYLPEFENGDVKAEVG
jgi:hypothetical protein